MKSLFLCCTCICLGVSSVGCRHTVAQYGEVREKNIEVALVKCLSLDPGESRPHMLRLCLAQLNEQERKLFAEALAHLYWNNVNLEGRNEAKDISRSALLLLRLPFSQWSRREAKRIALYTPREGDVGVVLSSFNIIGDDACDYPFWRMLVTCRPTMAERIKYQLGCRLMQHGENNYNTLFHACEAAEVWKEEDLLGRVRRYMEVVSGAISRDIALYDIAWEKHGFSELAEMRCWELGVSLRESVPGPFRRNEKNNQAMERLVEKVQSTLAGNRLSPEKIR